VPWGVRSFLNRKAYDVQEQISEMVQTTRAAMDMMTREVMMAGYDPSPTSPGVVGIPYNASQLQIRADLNGNEDTGDDSEDITYTYDATNDQIDRNTGGGDQPFAENIEVFTFDYLDGSGNTTTTTADIRQIRLTITARTTKADPDYGINFGYRTYTLISLVTPPNLSL
jgi:type IV pilus assembly protein PilW